MGVGWWVWPGGCGLVGVGWWVWAGGCEEVQCVGVLDVGACTYVHTYYTIHKNKPHPLPSQ